MHEPFVELYDCDDKLKRYNVRFLENGTVFFNLFAKFCYKKGFLIFVLRIAENCQNIFD